MLSMWSRSNNADQVSKLDEALAEERAKTLNLELEVYKQRSEVRAQLQENHKIKDLVEVLKQEQERRMKELSDALKRSEANNDRLEAALLSLKADVKQTASTQSSPTGVDAVGSGPGEPVHVVPPRRKRDFRITDSNISASNPK